jgi:hypothetical protein
VVRRSQISGLKTGLRTGSQLGPWQACLSAHGLNEAALVGNQNFLIDPAPPRFASGISR